MPKINFKDYSDNYREIKKEEKNTKKVNELKYQKELAEEINQKYFELKEYLDILKRNLNITFMAENEVEKNISDNINKIQTLISATYDLCKKSKIYSYWVDSFWVDSLKGTIGGFFAYLTVLIGAIVCEHFIIISWIRLLFQIITVLVMATIDILVSALSNDVPTMSSGFKALIGLLPFNNRYSFVKNFSKLKKLENEYKMLGEQYKEYLEYLESPEKSEVAENIIKTKEVKDLYLLEINKLIDKVKNLPLGEEREKYLEVLEKLAKLYKREKEVIILKNGRIHSEEEIQLGMSVLKQIAYIEMQINSSIYKNNKVNLLSEDYMVTLGKLDSAKDEELKRTLGLGKK